MADNVLQTLQHVIQDVIAPDVRELKVRLAALEKQSETQFNSLEKKGDTQYNSLRDQQEANFKALMAAIGESKAKQDLDTYKLIVALTARVAALEAARI
jgi:hypothetical protein